MARRIRYLGATDYGGGVEGWEFEDEDNEKYLVTEPSLARELREQAQQYEDERLAQADVTAEQVQQIYDQPTPEPQSHSVSDAGSVAREFAPGTPIPPAADPIEKDWLGRIVAQEQGAEQPAILTDEEAQQRVLQAQQPQQQSGLAGSGIPPGYVYRPARAAQPGGWGDVSRVVKPVQTEETMKDQQKLIQRQQLEAAQARDARFQRNEMALRANQEQQLQQEARITQLQEQSDARQQAVQKARDEADRIRAEANSMSVDTGRYFANKSTGEKLGMAIGFIFSRIAQSVLAANDIQVPSESMSIIRRAMNQDIQMQKDDIARTRGEADNALNRAYKEEGNWQAAESKVRIAQLEHTKLKAQELALGDQSTEIGLAYTDLKSKLDEEQLNLQASFEQTMAGTVKQRMRPAVSAQPARIVPESTKVLKDAAARKKAMEVLGRTPPDMAAEIKDLNDALQKDGTISYMVALQDWKDARASFVAKHGNDVPRDIGGRTELLRSKEGQDFIYATRRIRNQRVRIFAGSAQTKHETTQFDRMLAGDLMANDRALNTTQRAWEKDGAQRVRAVESRAGDRARAEWIRRMNRTSHSPVTLKPGIRFKRMR